MLPHTLTDEALAARLTWLGEQEDACIRAGDWEGASDCSWEIGGIVAEQTRRIKRRE